MFKIFVHLNEILPVYVREEDVRSKFDHTGMYAKVLCGSGSFQVTSPEFEVGHVRIEQQVRYHKKEKFEVCPEICLPIPAKRHLSTEDEWYQRRIVVYDGSEKVLFAIMVTNGKGGVGIQTPMEFIEGYYVDGNFGIKVEDEKDFVNVHLIF